MSSIWISEGTVVIPFATKILARHAYTLGRKPGAVLGISLPKLHSRVAIHQSPEEKEYEIVTKNGTEILEVRLSFLIVPARGAVEDRWIPLYKMAKIPLLAVETVLEKLEGGSTLQGLERPLAKKNWPLYRPGSFIARLPHALLAATPGWFPAHLNNMLDSQ